MTVAASSTSGQQPTPKPRAAAAPGRLAAVASPLIALSRDPQLLAAVRTVTGSARDVRTAGSEVDLSAALVAAHAGVLLIDGAAIVSPIATLTQGLRAQFPDLVLIVAGGHDEEGKLAAQISAGTVYRFLHKPVSEQRVRLFLEAAWRRYEQDDPLRQIATQSLPAWQPQSGRRAAFAWFVLAAVVTAAVPLTWMAVRESSSAPSDAAPAQAAPLTTARDSVLNPRRGPGIEHAPGRPAVAQALIERPATQNQLPDTPGSSAPAAATGAPTTRAGLAPTAIAGGTAAAAGAPTLIAGAPLPTAAAPAPGGAAAALTAAALTTAAAAQTPTSATLASAAQASDPRVADDLNRARQALERGQLIEPPEDNARYYIESARAVAPTDPEVLKTGGVLIARLEDSARQALAAKNPTQADHWAAAAADAGADAAVVASLHDQAAQLRKATGAEALAQLALSFDDSLQQGRLTEPASDSAKFYLAALVQAAAADPATQRARTAYGARALEEGRHSLAAGDYEATRRWAAEARAAGVADVEQLEAAIAAAQDEARPADSVVSESTLARTTYVAPEFPLLARQRNIQGWVDLEFLVGSDGAVSDLAVTGAQPVGVFEQAALDAVRHWRYRPVLRDGHAVNQRARVRVRFAVQP